MDTSTPITRNDEYRAFVRKHVCISCNEGNESVDQFIEAHHYMENEGGTALKCSDWHTVPLCEKCHAAFHATGALPFFTRHYDFKLAVALSRALVYRTQARLLAQWLDVF